MKVLNNHIKSRFVKHLQSGKTLQKQISYFFISSISPFWTVEPPVTQEFEELNISKSTVHCVKSVRIRSFSGQYFPAFRLNTERHGASLRIQSKCWKIRTRKTPNMDTFHALLRMLKDYHAMKMLGNICLEKSFETEDLKHP